ncbi:lipoprotein-releasing ABC transporter permease subunit [Pseudoduganella namucuonensis]|uniref:Lipoprotein-releasing system permease protein n=1 Tax=Pseudoduganella namucuonensis TaxID=1035707 RepID=A0A1I7HPV3_9BURK|nr:lipoprotein-releasing ABC transporter permease subunit [Pseudoduganella namucuonensis]SFU62700.1 lipoprotein-releasing system permease protein [Pseudoduganella namucuonensis]
MSNIKNLPSNLPFEWLVGLRYTRAGKRSGRNSFISFISAISMAGIALGVAALIIVLSVYNGFQKEVTERMLSVLGHIEMYDVRGGGMADWQSVAREALKNKEVKAAAPFVETQAMLVHGSDKLRPAIVRGILPEQEARVSSVVGQVKQGSFDALRPGAFGIVLGAELAKALEVEVGGKVAMALAQSGANPMSAAPSMRIFTVVGTFEAGHNEFDSGLAYVNLEDGQQILQLAGPFGLRLRVADTQRAPRIAAELKFAMGEGMLVRDWSKLNANWFAAVHTQKNMMFIILTLIIAVAAFNLVATLVMTVTDKQADIAILRTLGASPRSVMHIFMVQGALVGVLGTLMGVAGGVLLAANVDVIVPFIERALGMKFLSKDIYFISAVPSDLRLGDVAVIGATAIGLAFVATLYPSWRAAKVKPAEALRYE